MHAFDYLRNPGEAGEQPVYAVHGEDAYLRREVLGAIVRQALGGEEEDLAVVRFAGDQAQLADVLDEVRTLPFLSRRRVAIVEGADPFVTAHRKELEGFAERPAAAGVLVLSVKTWPANTKLAKLVERTGLAVECKAPRESELPAWLVGLARSRHSLRLEADAARLLVELVGPEVGLLAGEVDKLAVYIHPRKSIGREDVAKLVGAGRVEKIYTILDAATTGQGAEALADLDRLLASGEHPVGLLAMMSGSLLKVHHAGQLRLARLDVKTACREAGIPPFASEKVQRQHSHLGPARVARLPELLLKADLDLKGETKLAPRVVLERLLLELAAPRRD